MQLRRRYNHTNSGQLISALSYPKARLTAGLRLSMDPEGRHRTGISAVDSCALYLLSYLGVVPECCAWRMTCASELGLDRFGVGP